MPNIFDYITWRGDISMKQVPFNEIDNLILARFSYLPFDHIIIEPNEIVTIKEAGARFKKLNIEDEEILQKEDIELFPALARSERFSEIQITQYRNKIDVKEEKQFSAITLLLPDKTMYISYRGTDNTLVGWKEDFNMSFQLEVPSQIDALHYLEEIASQYSNPIRIGGHSKGGNLAVYAASFCKKKIQKRIINIYNNDGPGFHENIIQKSGYKQIISKVSTYVPQTSIVGRLLYHEENYTVVQSIQVGVMQHDLYTWQLQGKEFIHLEEVDNGSIFIDTAIKEWLTTVSAEQRGEFINIIFEILTTTEAETLAQIRTKWIRNSKILLTTYKNMDEESKKIITQTIEALFIIVKNNLLQKFPKLPEWKKKEKVESIED